MPDTTTPTVDRRSFGLFAGSLMLASTTAASVAAATANPSVELIQSVYAAFARGDVAFIASKVAPGARWDFNVAKSEVPWHTPIVGPAEVPKFIGAFIGNVALEAFEPRRFIAAEDEVIVHIRLAYVIKKSGRRVDQQQLHWWTVRGGVIERLRHFEDTAQVLGAWRG